MPTGCLPQNTEKLIKRVKRNPHVATSGFSNKLAAWKKTCTRTVHPTHVTNPSQPHHQRHPNNIASAHFLQTKVHLLSVRCSCTLVVFMLCCVYAEVSEGVERSRRSRLVKKEVETDQEWAAAGGNILKLPGLQQKKRPRKHKSDLAVTTPPVILDHEVWVFQIPASINPTVPSFSLSLLLSPLVSRSLVCVRVCYKINGRKIAGSQFGNKNHYDRMVEERDTCVCGLMSVNIKMTHWYDQCGPVTWTAFGFAVFGAVHVKVKHKYSDLTLLLCRKWKHWV